MARVDIDVESHDNTDTDEIRKKYKAFGDGLVKDMSAAGDKASAGLVAKLAAGVEAASKRVIKARNAETTATEKLHLAQQKMAELADDAKESTKIAAQNAYAAALRRVAEASDDTAAAQMSLAHAEERVRNAQGGPIKTGGVDIDITQGLKNMRAYAVAEMKATGIAAGAAFAGGLGPSLTTAGAAGFFIALAAMAQSSNEQVRASYKSLWDQVKLGAQESSSVLADEFIASAEQLGRTFNTLKPKLAEGMAAAQQPIRDITTGIDRLAKNAMPGLVTAAKASSQATDDLAVAMEFTGRGVSNFFTESSQGAAASGEAFRAFGQIVERLGTFAGRILATLANSSQTVFPQLASTVDATASAMENLAHSAMPALAAGAGLGLSAFSLLMNLASGLLTALGPLGPQILTVVAALKLLDTISFGGVTGRWNSFKQSIGDAEGPAGKMKAGLKGLVTTLGPVALGAAAVTFALEALSNKQQRAAEASAQHARNEDALVAALTKSKGAIDNNVRATAQQNLANTQVADTGKSVLQYAKDLGVSLPRLQDAYLGNKKAQDEVVSSLDAMIKAGTTVIDTESGKQEVMDISAQKALNLKEAMRDGNGEFQKAVERNKLLAEAAGETSTATTQLKDDFAALGDSASTAEQKTAALYEIMRRMAGGAPDIEEATKRWEELIDKFNTKEMNFDEKTAGTRKWADSLVDAQGKINLTTEDGRKLYDQLKGMATAFDEQATAMKANGATQDQISGKLQTMRDDFITLATKMGFTKEQAALMANQFGLIPTKVSTLITSNLSPEIQKAIELGGRLESLPDGNFVVHANTRTAQGMLDSFVQRNDGRVIHISTTVAGVSTNRTAGGMRWQAAGGPASGVSFAAQGGPRTGPTVFNERGLETATLPNRDIVSLGTLPTGSQVNPHAGNRMLGGQNGSMNVRLSYDGSGNELVDALIRELRVRVEYSGGTVETLLGGRS